MLCFGIFGFSNGIKLGGLGAGARGITYILDEPVFSTAKLISLFGEDWTKSIDKTIVVPSEFEIGGAALTQGTPWGGELTLVNNGIFSGLGGLANSGKGGDALEVQLTGDQGQLLRIENADGIFRAGGGGGGRGGVGGNGYYVNYETVTEYSTSARYVTNAKNIGTFNWPGGGHGNIPYTGGWWYYPWQLLDSRLLYDGEEGWYTERTYNMYRQQNQNVTYYTVGGDGGNGGRGAGYDGESASGSDGVAGGTNAGSGGSGGAGGSWGQVGDAGLSGNSGNVAAGSLGSTGGLPGAAISGAFTLLSQGTLIGSAVPL